MSFPLTSPLFSCISSTFSNVTLFGASIIELGATQLTNVSLAYPYYPTYGGLNFCNVSVTYTHPGQNDTLRVQVWLPSTTYTERMQGIGGGSYGAGLNDVAFGGMALAVSQGYAAVTLDAGLPSQKTVDLQPEDWALLSPGNVDLYALQNLASVSLSDATLLAKDFVESYYGQLPKFSYWNGCSQGGRQGLMLAQQYPDLYDGILAASPAISWNKWAIGDYYPTFVMDQLKQYPYACELEAIRTAAINACDELDGVVDGIITDPEACNFDPSTVVGGPVNCSDAAGPLTISDAAVKVVQAVWGGARDDRNESLWFGLNKDAAITGSSGLAETSCTNGTCSRSPPPLCNTWLQYFLAKDPSVDLSTMTQTYYDDLFRISVQQYTSIYGTDDPDLSAFRDSGGKMITYHGLSDVLIPPMTTQHYYDAATAVDQSVQDYYRLFFSPGLGHCDGGLGGYPAGAFEALQTWVENGTAPDTLLGTSAADSQGNVIERPLCLYPKKQIYKGSGNTSVAENFACE
ncbi:putative feruloyl esterase [Lachnellula hyalina]|uniref:Carboxylic ester hydrolase n=1 Tax=Lachnellula hyalina TaxID=1316788 RepID=A0A8H8QXH2_9HELO|nr:putative feruloyl esterase [Lachnellula hyalina]TVY23871.1 putative feruloyl esterase [Lachnellula hyalina]